MARTKKPHELGTGLIWSSLDGSKICFVNGTFDTIPKNHGDLPDAWPDLQQGVADHGGATVRKGDACTHLVATKEQFNKQGARVRDAIDAGIPVVTYDWLVAALGADEPVDTSTYLLDDSAARLSTPQPDDSGYASPYTHSVPGSTIGKRSTIEDDAQDDGHDRKKPKVSIDDINVPVDEYYRGSVGDKVYMSRSGVPYDATLNQTGSKKNSNTSYIIQIIEKKNGEFVCWTRWGRIGEKGQADALGDGTLADAVKQFEKKFKDKAGLLWAKRGSPPVTGKVSALASG